MSLHIGRPLMMLLGTGATGALLLAGCGGTEATATPQPPPTPTSVPATPTATRPAPTPTPTSAGMPTPVVNPAAKRGGTVSLRALPGNPAVGDTYDQRGAYDFDTIGPALNNLIWKDPYGKSPAAITGELAESWDVAATGTEITFKLRKGVTFHNGTPFTAKDVVYNLDRAVNPRSATMTYFKPTLAPMQSVTALDDSTVKLVLKTPSNIFIQALTLSGALIYPAEFPFPEKLDAWKQQKFIGTGPFKVSTYDPGIKMEYVRNDKYFKPGLPYADGLVFISMTPEVATASFRAGKIDASDIDSSTFQYQRKELAKQWGFVAIDSLNGVYMVHLNQKPPLLEPKVRQAISLALDRPAMVNTWLQGDGDPIAPPLVPPERGGQWGISQSVLKGMLQYQADKGPAMARAAQLLKEAGIDPGQFTINVMNTTTFPGWGEVVESNIRALGFGTSLETLASNLGTERFVKGEFMVATAPWNMLLDDPGDYLAREVRSDGAFNYGKWQNPKLDSLFEEQDRTLDYGKRKALIDQIQQIVLDDNVYIPAVMRGYYHGYMPWLKNFPTNIPLSTDNLFRWEQVWLDR